MWININYQEIKEYENNKFECQNFQISNLYIISSICMGVVLLWPI